MFVIARSSHGRPTLQHLLTEPFSSETMCGLEVSSWSRAYQSVPISAVLCKKCAKLS